MTYDKERQRIKAEGYRDGEEVARREDNAALSGMTLGFLIVLVTGAIAGTVFYLYRQNQPVPTVLPSSSPNVMSPAPEKETIIREEKVRELVPVPQPASPQPNVNPPNVNIVVPSNPPPEAAPNAPAPEATAPKPENESSNPASSQPSVAPSPN